MYEIPQRLCYLFQTNKISVKKRFWYSVFTTLTQNQKIHHCAIQLKDHQIVESSEPKRKQELFRKIGRLQFCSFLRVSRADSCNVEINRGVRGTGTPEGGDMEEALPLAVSKGGGAKASLHNSIASNFMICQEPYMVWWSDIVEQFCNNTKYNHVCMRRHRGRTTTIFHCNVHSTALYNKVHDILNESDLEQFGHTGLLRLHQYGVPDASNSVQLLLLSFWNAVIMGVARGACPPQIFGT